MACLLIKELKIRGLVKRTLIVTPANPSFQWQRELKDKFRESFEVVRSDVLRANYWMNPWQEKNQVITSVSWVSRVEDAKQSLLRSQWDLIREAAPRGPLNSLFHSHWHRTCRALSLGHLLALHVTPADEQERAQAGELAGQVQKITRQHRRLGNVSKPYM